MLFPSSATTAAVLLVSSAAAETIAQINGVRFLSPHAGKTVTNVTGLVTAKYTSGFFLRSTTPDDKPATSESIQVFSTSFGASLNVGDIVSLDATVSEYRSSRDYLYLTELIPTAGSLQVISTGNTVTPVILGTVTTGLIGKKRLFPPTQQYTSLDGGDVFAFPNNVTQVSVANPVLKPGQYGLDFWESLSGELVTVRNATAVGIPNSFGDTWIIGDWPVTGLNERGGLTISDKDGNPEAILIQTPLDGSKNPTETKLGDGLGDITGVVTYAFGQYTIKPRTAIATISSQSPELPPPTELVQTGGCSGVTFAQYNINNFVPNDTSRTRLATDIVEYLKSPSILFLQEIEDNSGDSNNGVTAANDTLKYLISLIAAAGGPTYNFFTVSVVDGTTGGIPGGNIRNAYLFNPKYVKPAGRRPGKPMQANEVLAGPKLKYNPGLLMPNSSAFDASRRPLAAQWTTADGKNDFFTVNVHGTSKGGSTSLFGDARPPVNLGLEQRDAEAQVVADFVKQILAEDANAKVIVAGDWNEFQFVKPQTDFVSNSGLKDLDVVVGKPAVDIFTYLFVQNSQSLDHMYVSDAIASKSPKFEHVHVNSFVSYDTRSSDHDPSVALLNVCA